MENTIDITALLTEAQEIQGYLEIEVSDDPNELKERIAKLLVLMARSGQMLADAKYVQDTKRSEIFGEHSKLILKMPATVSTRFIESQTGEVNYLVNWLDRINRSCVHQMEGSRTLLSFEKEQSRLTRSGY